MKRTSRLIKEIGRDMTSNSQFRGPVQQYIEETIRNKYKYDHLEVTNESHRQKEDESHFHVLMVSDIFKEVKPLIKRHRMINDLFMAEKSKSLKFHSLRLTLKTPSQWKASETSPVAPKCTGKGDGRHPTDTSMLVD